MNVRPPWWDWELEFSTHLLKRMTDRGFTEVDLRLMMEEASELKPDEEPGRWVVHTDHARRPWEIIVEPDRDNELLVVITAYPVGQP